MTIIPKGETHSWAFAQFGEEWGERYVVSEDLVVIPKEDYDKVQGILAEMRKGPPPGDQTPASMACYTFADRIDKALSGNGAGENKKGKTMPEYKQYIRCHIVKATPMTRGNSNALRGKETPQWENPAEEGYHVVYPDGYESWCPKAQFEAAGRPIDGMTFGMAIEAMKFGAKVARKGWNGKGMWICIPLCAGPKEIPANWIMNIPFADFLGKPNAKYAEQNGGTVKIVPYVTMKAADGTFVTGWLASQTDMLAEDWRIVE